MKKVCFINIKLPYELKKSLKMKAASQDMTITEAIRMIVAQYVGEKL